MGWENAPVWKLESISCPAELRARPGGWGYPWRGICGGSGGETGLSGGGWGRLGLSGPGAELFPL